uniref:Uncharacterized protein n=1 Tax=Panagrolaimus sp. JU765 TaxID=591449 RepID=A0AC34R3Z1_9BILA
MPGSKSCFLVKKAVDYPNDELYCEKFGGHLASIHSFPENSFIT